MYNDYALIKKSTLTDIGDAIRIKKGTSNLIDPADFSSEIESIEGGTLIEPILQEKIVYANGEVTPDDGYDGLSKVTVSVSNDVEIDHVEVESIIADGASYIKTDILPSPLYSIEMEFKLHTIAVNWDFLFGTRTGNYARWHARFNEETDGILKVGRSSTWSGKETVYSSSLKKNNCSDYKIFKLAKNEIYIDNVLVQTFDLGTSGHYPYPLWLFSINESDGVSESGDCGYLDCKYVKIWDDNDELILNLIPVVKTDGTVCMFDMVNSEYYYNAGTGTFTYPNEVIPEPEPEEPSTPETPTDALINIDMTTGANIGTGGSAYDAVNHNGVFSDGKITFTSPGCLTVPTDFMAESSTEPWTVAFTIDNYTLGTGQYSRIARGNNDVPSIYYNKTTTLDGFQHKLVSTASHSTDDTSKSCGTTWYDTDFYWVNASQGLMFSGFSGTKTTFIFRNNGTEVSLWVNGEQKCTADSSKYVSKYRASTFSIGNDEYSTATGNMSSLECSMLKLWDRAITDEEIGALSSITTPEEPEPTVSMEEAMYEYYGIDKEEYPYLYIVSWYNTAKDWRIKPIFCKSVNNETGVLTGVLGIQTATTKSLTTDEYNNTAYYNDINMVFDYMKESNIVFDNSYESYQSDNLTDKCMYYTNWDATYYTNWADLRTLYIG